MRLTTRLLIAVGLWMSGTADGADLLKLEHPQSHQVIQRIGLAPGAGYAGVRVLGELPKEARSATWEYRVVGLADGARGGSDWTEFTPTIANDKFEGSARVAAGGWYRLELRCRAGDDILAAAAVEPVGVGEVFVVAGQSYATNCNDERLTVADAEHRVVAFDSAKQTWGVANDPQPVFDGSDGGSIWPPLGDALAKELQVPIGFANVAIGGSSSAQWLPEGNMFPRLVAAGQSLGTIRAVLWQQGESDVLTKNTTEGYVANVNTIRETAAKAWGLDPPWLLAKSTHHPTVYNDPEGEGRIRAGIDELVKQPGFRTGPDTDTLTGENRGDINSRRHFTGIGQRRAAELWLASIRRELFTATDAGQLRVGVAESDITPPIAAQSADLRIGTQPVNKILFLGNSITLHSPAPQIGWKGNWGMAASSTDKDYVHVLLDRIANATGGKPQVMVKNIADFERRLTDYNLQQKLKQELAFNADVVVIALGENASAPKTDEAKTQFATAFANLFSELKKYGQPTLFVRSQFWQDAEKDQLMKQACEDAGGIFIDISKLGFDATNYARAERQIEHAGVAGHPGDKGMQELADALWNAIQKQASPSN